MPLPMWILRLDGAKRQDAMTALAEYEQAKNNARLALDTVLVDMRDQTEAAQQAYKTAQVAARRRYNAAKERIESGEKATSTN